MFHTIKDQFVIWYPVYMVYGIDLKRFHVKKSYVLLQVIDYLWDPFSNRCIKELQKFLHTSIRPHFTFILVERYSWMKRYIVSNFVFQIHATGAINKSFES